MPLRYTWRRPALPRLTSTSGVHLPACPAASGTARVTLWPGPAVTLNWPLRTPLVNPATQRSPQLTVIRWDGAAQTCTEMLRGWEMSPCTEQDTNSPSVVQLPMLSVRALLAALDVACAAVIPPAASNTVPAAMTAIGLIKSFSLSELDSGPGPHT